MVRLVPHAARHSWLLALVGVLMACGAPREASPDGMKDSASVAGDPETRHTVVFMGTSLTAGYGLAAHEAFPARIQAHIDSVGLPFRVVNAGVSGETSAGALRRVDWVAGQGTVAVFMIETGANDGLRGQSVDSLRSNLRAIVERATALDPRPAIIVAGMEALPNLGRTYGTRFRQVFPDVAREFDVTFLPFLLDGVAGDDRLNQADGVHPTAAGAQRVADNVWKTLEPILDSIQNARTDS